MTPYKKRWVIQFIQTSHVKHKYQYLPYATGLLQAYTIRHASDLSRYIFLPIFLDYKALDEAVSEVILADVFGFSTYVWSYQYNLALAQAIKMRKPEALIIFGGPQVPDHAEAFLREHPFIDVCVHGEGERVFLGVLESLPDKDWSQIGGISWLDEKGFFQHNPQMPRQRDLDAFPSPYLMGLFDDFIRTRERYWVALWESNRGCPFSCTFCDWGSNVAAKVYRFGMERVKQEIEWFAQNKIFNVTGCDANFGILPRDLEIADHFVTQRQLTGYPKILFVQGAKNTTERSYEVNKKIIQAGLGDMVTLSLQSINPTALKSIRRDNISLETYRELQKRCNREDINTYTDYLVGLPGETYESFVDGVSQIIDEGQHHLINFNNIYILPNAEMNQPEYRKKYGTRTVRIPQLEQSQRVHDDSHIQEWHEVVIGADSFSQDDWVKMRSFAWWIEMLYMLRKIMQLPIMLTHMLTGLSYRDIFEHYAFGALEDTPITTQIQAFFIDKAADICTGKADFCMVHDVKEPFWLGVVDFILAGISRADIRQAFYAEQKQVIVQLLKQHQKQMPEDLLDDALVLNEALAGAFSDQSFFSLELRYNIWAVTTNFRRGLPWELRKGHYVYAHDWVGSPFFEVSQQGSGSPVL